MLERDQVLEVVSSVFAVAVMIGAMYWIGTNYSTDGATFTPEGGQLLVGAIVGFIVLMTAIGVALAFALNGPEDGLEDDESETLETA